MASIGISVNASQTASTRVAFARNVTEGMRSAQMLATGDAIINAYQDPSGLSIGTTMKSVFNTLSIVARGIEQSQSMLYIAEDGLKSAIDVTMKMLKVLANSQLGFMNDHLIKTTLSPEYVQLKDEINRIADQTKFNGARLLDASGSTISTLGVKTIAQKETFDFVNAYFSKTAKLTLGDITASANGTPASTITLGNAGLIGDVADLTTGTVTLSNGEFTRDATTGDVIITNATLSISNVKMSAGTNSAVGNVTITDATITIGTGALPGPIITSSGITGANTVKVEMPAFNAKNIGFDIVTPDTTNPLNSLTLPTAFAASAATAAMDVEILGIVEERDFLGGVGAISTFKFAAGDDLAKSMISVNFPNVRLVDNKDANGNTIKGAISTLNIVDLVGDLPISPTDLTTLQNDAEAVRDIAIVKSFLEFLIVERDNMGAYESRFINVQNQLLSSLEQIDNAQGAILNTDLAKTNEDYSRANVKVQICISMLRQMNEQLEALARLVQG